MKNLITLMLSLFMILHILEENEKYEESKYPKAVEPVKVPEHIMEIYRASV